MVKGRKVTIAGTEYERVPKSGSNKRKRPVSAAVSRKRTRTAGSLSGSGDYIYRGPTPFGDAGHYLGGGLAGALNYFGIPVNTSMFKTVGGRLGHAIGGIFGSGDYHVGGASSALITNGRELPKFKTNKFSNVICHREYIKDIVSSGTAGAFKVESFMINPGLATTFPWLATVAQNYEQYKIHGIVFEFKTTSSDALNSTNTALGSVIMATEYNPSLPNFNSKQQMEAYEMSQSAKPSLSQLHGIECASNQTPVDQLYVRSGTVPTGQDQRWFDRGNFQIASQGLQATNVVIGELWVSYMVEFFKPKQPNTIGGTIPSLFIQSSDYDANNPWGKGTITYSGNLSANLKSGAPTVLQINCLPNEKFAIVMEYQGTSSAATTGPTSVTVTGGSINTNFLPGVSGGIAKPGFGFTTTNVAYIFAVTANNTTNTLEIAIAADGVFPGGTKNCNILVTELDASVA